jgi:phosphate transport system protein
MERHFQQELKRLRESLLLMAGRVEDAIAKANKSLVDRNASLARDVIAEDTAIDELELSIDDQCIKLLALHQPMASDLRFITSAMKINSDLERIGDHAVNIAEKSTVLAGQPPLKPLIDIPRMAELAQGMVKDSIDAFVEHAPDKARAVCERDDLVDDLQDQVIRELLTYMLADPKAIQRGLDLILVAKNLERIADLATNIAEEVIFILQARTIKHRAEEKKGGASSLGQE